MASRRIRKEHKAACEAMDILMQEGIKAGGRGPLPEEAELYLRLSAVRNTLEWCEPILIKTGEGAPESYRHLFKICRVDGLPAYCRGPVFAELYP